MLHRSPIAPPVLPRRILVLPINDVISIHQPSAIAAPEEDVPGLLVVERDNAAAVGGMGEVDAGLPMASGPIEDLGGGQHSGG